MIENDDLTNLRARVADLDENEKLALAAFLACDCQKPIYDKPNYDYYLHYISGNFPAESLKNAFEISTLLEKPKNWLLQKS